MNRLYFTEEAELDLTQIIEFTNKQWGVDQARQYLEKIHQILHLLTETLGQDSYVKIYPLTCSVFPANVI